MSELNAPRNVVGRESASSFRGPVLRGLGVLLPPLLTIVVLIWAWNAISNYVLRPMETGVRYAIVWSIGDIKRTVPETAAPTNGERRLDGFTYQGERYIPDGTGRRFFPEYVRRYVDDNLDRLSPYDPSPITANAYWHRYIELKYLPRSVVVPLFLLLFLTALYFLGRLFSHGIGNWLVKSIEAGIQRIPLVSKVYGSVKQVTDFAFSEREIELNRVVAVEYPRKGCWSIGFVTGNGLSELSNVTGEPMLSILIPTSPMPMTGFTIVIPRSQAVDLHLTMDEAIQYLVSCGVVTPGTSAKVLDGAAKQSKVVTPSNPASLT